jgi:hypothetical protein
MVHAGRRKAKNGTATRRLKISLSEVMGMRLDSYAAKRNASAAEVIRQVMTVWLAKVEV